MIGVAGTWAPRVALMVAAIALVPSGNAQGATPERTYSVAYDAPASCPGRAAFLEAIRVRATESSLGDSGELAFDVRIAQEGELARGTLDVRFRTGERFAREVPAAPCEDVVTSMAIMAGLLLSGALLPEPAPAPNEPAPAEPPPAALPPPPDATAAPPSTPSAAAPGKLRAGPSARFRGGLFVDGRLDFAAAPFPAFGIGAGLDALLERDDWLSPSLRFGVLYVTGEGDELPLGAAHFALRALTARACPVRVRSRPFAFVGCGLFEGGVLTASPRSTPGATGDATMTWLGFGGSGRVEAGLGEQVAVELEAALFGLAHHDQFVLQPGNVNVHTVPVVSGAISLGVVARWP